jgi:predicted ATPase
MVRAIIDPQRAATLVGDSFTGIASYARTVTERTRFDVAVIVVLTRPVTDEDIASAEALGARIGFRYTVINGYSATVADAAVPALRALPQVQAVEADGVVCLL